MTATRRATVGLALATVFAGLVAPAATLGPSSAAQPALTLVVEPTSGMAPLYASMVAARSLEMELYELRDPRAEAVLAADAARGADVRVILDSTERSENQAAFAYLTAHHVAVHWSSDRFERTHEKAWVADSVTAVVSSGNLVAADEDDTRDFAVIDRDPADVAAIETTFADDWGAGSGAPAPNGADLVWSPGSQARLVSLIDQARHTISLENEEMDDAAVTDALAAAARRQVVVRVTMTADSEWDRSFSALRSAGVLVHLLPDASGTIYIHAKAIVVDVGFADECAFVGSENFSAASLEYNRELGIVTTAPSVLDGLAAVLAKDYAAGRPFA